MTKSVVMQIGPPGGGVPLGTDFVFTVETTGADETFTIPCVNNGTFNATITSATANAPHDSGASVTAYNDANLVLTFPTAGIHTIRVSGTFTNITFNDGGDRLKVRTVEQLGDVGWTRLNDAFRGCTQMTSFTAGTTDTSLVTNMGAAFQNCPGLVSADLSGLDVSNVTVFFRFFLGCSGLASLDLTGWDTSSGTNMGTMFQNCSSLTSLDLTGWNTSSVANMSGMFQNCASLTSLIISGFDISGLNGVTDLNNFLTNGLMATAQYDATLIAWAAQTVFTGMSPNFGNSQYTLGGAAEAARNKLINDDGWFISDAGGV